MKVKVKSYELKNIRTPSTKSKPLKSKNNNLIGKRKKNGGLKDNRKYANDTSLPETEKLARRMALEQMKRESVVKTKSQKGAFWSNEEYTLESDEFTLKSKQLDGFDAGVDESSEDEVMEHDTEKYFDNNNISKKKKTLEEKIRDSKIVKYEISKENEKDAEVTLEVNEKYRDEFRFILPKLAASAKSKSATEYKPDTVFADMFQESIRSLIDKPRPQKADGKSIHTKVNEKKSEKLVETKLKKLREKLAKDGIVNSEGEESDDNNDYNLNMGSNDDDENEISYDDESESSDHNNEENDDDVEEDVSVSDNCDDEDDDLNDIDLDYQKPAKDDQKNTLQDLKKIINESNKSTKRKHDEDAEDVSSKKPKVDHSKNEIDCFRVILKMPDLRNEALFVLAQEMSIVDLEEETIVRKMIFATLFQTALELNSPNSYSPELVGFIRHVLSSAGQHSSSWLSVQSNLTYISENKLLNICTENKKDLEKVTVSVLFHALNLLLGVVQSNKTLPNAKSLFAPFKGLIERLPSHFYPLWLMEKLDETVASINSITVADAPVLRMKKVFKIIELLEPDLEDKFDPAKNLVKSQKDKLKKETKATKKEFKTIAMDKIKNEVAEDRKQSQIRNKKTMEIMNGICQK